MGWNCVNFPFADTGATYTHTHTQVGKEHGGFHATTANKQIEPNPHKFSLGRKLTMVS
jgi:hypothetical protein